MTVSTQNNNSGEFASDKLDEVFHALANSTRRQMLARLAYQPATIGELAKPFDMTLPGASKHLRVLERAGLVNREIDGRVHRCSFVADPLIEAQTWLTHNEQFWNGQLDQLARHFTENANQ